MGSWCEGGRVEVSSSSDRVTGRGRVGGVGWRRRRRRGEGVRLVRW